MLLAIDTATRTASIALYASNGIQAELTWRSRENHTVELMPQIIRLLDLSHVTVKELKAIAVASGPGSYTGLRVGMSAAKGLAYGAHIPIFGISTLDALAHSQSATRLPIWAIVAAGRGRFSVAKYFSSDGRIARADDFVLVDAVSLADLATRGVNSSPAIFCGEYDEPVTQMLSRRLGVNAIFASPAMNARRASFMAELAWARFLRGESDNVETFAPIYPPIS